MESGGSGPRPTVPDGGLGFLSPHYRSSAHSALCTTSGRNSVSEPVRDQKSERNSIVTACAPVASVPPPIRIDPLIASIRRSHDSCSEAALP